MESEQQLTKAQLIASIADLQTTLRELNGTASPLPHPPDRSETVKSENDSLREENIVYRDYILRRRVSHPK